MSPSDPPDRGENPFGDDPFGELSKLFGSLGFGSGGAFGGMGDPWQSAKQLAETVASEGGTDPNLDPIVRMAVEDLARVADLHVRQFPGLHLPPAATVRAVSRREWTDRTLDAFRPFFERFGQAIGTAGPEMPAGDPMAAMMTQMFAALGPMMVAASAGSMIGHLGQHALGQYELPVPRPGDDVLVVPTSIDVIAAESGIDIDEFRLVVLIHELAAHSVLSTPHVRRQLDNLLIDFASGFRPNPQLIEERFGNITDLSQIHELSASMNDPDAVLDMMRSPAQDLIVPQLDALIAAILGYVDHVVATVSAGLVPNQESIRAVIRGRLTDAAPADRFMDQLLGLDIDAATIERGDAFVRGVLERAGDDGLARLWADELDLPTASEIDAPGLWLARIGLDPDLPGGADLEIPDDLSGLDDL